MKLFKVLVSLIASLAMAVSAVPQISKAVAAVKPSSNPADFKKYHLKTQVINGPTRFQNLFVYSYHTGAGLSDACLKPGKSFVVKAFMNGTYQQFAFPEGDQPYFPWGMNFYYGQYSGWQPVTIDAGLGAGGFYINDTGLQHKPRLGFGGWLACDWWHGVPQLFWKIGYYDSRFPAPSNCADIQLVPHYI